MLTVRSSYLTFPLKPWMTPKPRGEANPILLSHGLCYRALRQDFTVFCVFMTQRGHIWLTKIQMLKCDEWKPAAFIMYQNPRKGRVLFCFFVVVVAFFVCLLVCGFFVCSFKSETSLARGNNRVLKQMKKPHWPPSSVFSAHFDAILFYYTPPLKNMKGLKYDRKNNLADAQD